MSHDESDLENISMKVRPMNIVDEFQQICNMEWLEAKMFLDEKLPDDQMDEKTKTGLLAKIISVRFTLSIQCSLLSSANTYMYTVRVHVDVTRSIML